MGIGTIAEIPLASEQQAIRLHLQKIAVLVGYRSQFVSLHGTPLFAISEIDDRVFFSDFRKRVLRVYNLLLLDRFDFLCKYFNLLFKRAVSSTAPCHNDLWCTNSNDDQCYQSDNVFIQNIEFASHIGDFSFLMFLYLLLQA